MSLEYTPPDAAFEEAGRRLCDPALQEKVRVYLGGVWPAGFEEVVSPIAVFAPYLAKGSETEVDALKKADKSGFATAVATYRDSAYVTANPTIVDCYRAPLKLPKQQQRPWVVPEAERSGMVGDASTIYSGLDIIGYWNGIRNVVLEENRLPVDDTVVDFGGWYAVQAVRFGWEPGQPRSPFYYQALMGLYASGRAVLFDTPPTSFATTVMKPAYDGALKELGVASLLTNELQPGKRDWTDLTFLDTRQVEGLLTEGKIQ